MKKEIHKTRLVSIGRIYRHHGFPRDGVSYFKMKFPLPGGESLKGQQHIWLSQGKTAPYTEHQKIELAEAPKPHGGKWGQATGAILALSTSSIAKYGEVLNGHDVSLERSQFPNVGKGEFYLCDLIGAQVQDGSQKLIGSVKSYAWLAADVYNLEVLTSDGEAFDFPAKWIDWSKSEISFENSSKSRIVVPDISEWMNL